MKKIISIFSILFIFILLASNISFAAEQATAEAKVSKTDLNQKDEFETTLSIKNNSVTNGISIMFCQMKYDESVFNIKTLNYDEEMSKVTGMTNTILKSFKEENYPLLFVDNNWIIMLMESDNVKFVVAISATSSVPVSTSSQEIGKIKLQVLESAQNQKTKIEFSNCFVGNFMDMEDFDFENFDLQGNDKLIAVDSFHTDSITIGGSFEDTNDIPSLDNKTNESNNKQNNSNQTQKNSDQAQTETPYTGVEDVMPFIIIALIFGIFGFIKYSKYKEIN